MRIGIPVRMEYYSGVLVRAVVAKCVIHVSDAAEEIRVRRARVHQLNMRVVVVGADVFYSDETCCGAARREIATKGRGVDRRGEDE